VGGVVVPSVGAVVFCVPATPSTDESVLATVGGSVITTVRGSVSATVGESVVVTMGGSVLATVGATVRGSVTATVGATVVSAAVGESVVVTMGGLVSATVGGSVAVPVGVSSFCGLNDRLPICLRLKVSFSESNHSVSPLFETEFVSPFEFVAPFEATTHKISRRNRLMRVTESFMFSNRWLLGT